jgi:putative DNA primase/helicase
MTTLDEINELKQQAKGKKKPDLVDIANELIDTYKLKAINDTDHPIYIYKEKGDKKGIYTRAENYLAAQIKKPHPEVTLHDLKEIFFTIWSKEGVSVERAEFDSDPWAIHFANGWFDLRTWTFEPHGENSHDRLSLRKSKVRYNPEATCPVIVKALSETLSPENKEMYLKMVGYCFLPTYAYKKAFVLIGGKDSGKSTFKELIGELLGWDNVAAVAWSDVEKPYMAAELYGKLANLASEITKANLLDIRVFKQLTGDDTITSRKIRQEPITFKSRAKMIIAVNDMPEFGEIDEAAIGRIIIIDFDRQFREGEINPNLLAEMSTPEELSGLLNLALDSLKQILKDNGFNEPDLDDKVAQYKERTSVLAKFIAEKCVIPYNPTEADRIHTKDILTAYALYCREHNERPLSDKMFGKELKAAHGIDKKRESDGKRLYFYPGIRLKRPDDRDEPPKPQTPKDGTVAGFSANN